jgi:hypothetical protein
MGLTNRPTASLQGVRPARAANRSSRLTSHNNTFFTAHQRRPRPTHLLDMEIALGRGWDTPGGTINEGWCMCTAAKRFM